MQSMLSIEGTLKFQIQSSDEELPAEEEEEVLRLQKEKAKSLTEEDFGLEDVTDNEGDKEPTFEVGFPLLILRNLCFVVWLLQENCADQFTFSWLFQEILVHGKPAFKPYASKEGKEDNATAYEEVKKDINALTREEQVDVLNR